jgi:hypothetical protein
VTIKTKVLGERLNQSHMVSIVNKHSESSCIVRSTSGSETLVSAIKKGEKISFLHNFTNLLPLVLGWIHSKHREDNDE